mmetsp:Transcript_9879/g.19751  ORF Transcript_9879/g.19751 Transcript_9879/m.19751 type:complete len:132 (-) Transcript_9879:40-435(-)
MSLKGIKQMKELFIRYSDYDGSSRGVREWIRTSLVPFAELNPDIIVKTELKRCKHPFLRGSYVNGNSKTIGIKNLQPDDIHNYALDLRNQIGRKVNSAGYAKPVVSRHPSIQGQWHERMDLIGLEMKITRK